MASGCSRCSSEENEAPGVVGGSKGVGTVESEEPLGVESACLGVVRRVVGEVGGLEELIFGDAGEVVVGDAVAPVGIRGLGEEVEVGEMGVVMGFAFIFAIILWTLLELVGDKLWGTVVVGEGIVLGEVTLTWEDLVALKIEDVGDAVVGVRKEEVLEEWNVEEIGCDDVTTVFELELEL